MFRYKLVWCVLYAVGVTAGGPPYECTRSPDGNSYRKEVLASDIEHVNHLVADWKTDKLYFSYFSESVNYLSATLDIEDKSLSIIEELPSYCSHAVDQSRGEVYAGCRNDSGRGGLYKYDSDVKKFLPFGALNEDVNYVSFGDALYYTSTQNQLYTFREGKAEEVFKDYTLVYDFAVNSKGDKVFKTASYHFQKAGSNEIGDLYNLGGSYSLAVDPRGDIYACNPPSIYRVDPASGTAKEVIYGAFCQGLASDKDGNLIYSDDNSNQIIRLVKCDNPV